MDFLKKYYIYAIELITGNIIFNIVYAIIKTLTFYKIGAINETFIDNMMSSFAETFIIYIILYIIAVVLQILYDKSIVNKLNNKLNKTKGRGELLWTIKKLLLELYLLY